jgi:hypothetical protein
MSSSIASEPLDLEHGLPVRAEDVAWLAAQPPPSIAELRARPLSKGEPFRLPA